MSGRKYRIAWAIASVLTGFAGGVYIARNNGQAPTAQVKTSSNSTSHESARQNDETKASKPDEDSPGSALPEGRYDIRQGAAGYAQIIGTFGALAVAALFALFAMPQVSSPHVVPLVPLAGGLLIVAILASTGGAIGLAAIGAEQDLTGNLVPAAMFLGVAASVSLVSVLGAFEVLIAIHLPKSTTLFAVIVGASGIMGAFFVALSIADSWHTGPRDPMKKKTWQETQWIRTQEKGDRHTRIAALLGAAPASAGIGLRLANVHITPSTSTIAWLIGGSLILPMGAIAFAGLRTRHPADGTQKGLRPWEAYSTTLAVSSFALVLMIMLPTAQHLSGNPATPHAHPTSPTSPSVTSPPKRSAPTANASSAK